jgi:flagellum-specific peptidoglycan hydrolase FlgJ
MVTKAQVDFITKIGDAARIACMETGIPASITIAQAIRESAWGTLRLAAEYGNYFGIQATDGAHSRYIEFATDEYAKGVKQVVEARYRWYKQPIDCFRAHAWLLAHCARYAPAMQRCMPPENFAFELQDCGYSTHPNYCNLLLGLVSEFNLRNYDVQPEPNEPARAA